MKKTSTTVLSAIVSVILLAALCVPAFAASTADAKTPVDTSHVCTLTLDYTYEGKAMPGIALKLYKIADFSADFQYTPTARFAEKGIAINGIKSQTEWDKLASTLSALIALENLTPDAAQSTGEDGKAHFSGLSTGLYFTDQIRREEEDGTVYTFKRVLVTLPELNAEGEWNYDVSAAPKVDVYVPEKVYIDYRVNKLWKDTGYENLRPASVSVTILKNGTIYESVALNADKNWTYTWTVEDDGSVWQVVETDVPKDYTMTAGQQGTVFSITNTYEKPDTPPDNPPPTGDSYNVRLWIFVMSVAGVIFVCSGVFAIRKQREND